jgi:replicative DNA helicase
MIEISDRINEFALLASACFNKSTLIDIMDLDEDVFYYEENLQLFKAIKSIYDKTKEIDLLSLRQELLENNIEADKTISEIAIQGTIVNTTFIKNILKDYSEKRKLYSLAETIKGKAQIKSITKDDITKEILDQIRDLNEARDSSLIALNDIIQKGLEQYVIPSDIPKTGFYDIDKNIIGLFSANLIIIAARPGNGKTTLALNIVRNVSEYINAVFVSLEMPVDQLALKLLSAESGIDSMDIKRGKISEIEFDKLKECNNKLAKLNFYFIDEPGARLETVISKLHRYMHIKKIGLIVVDYLQLFKVKAKESRRVEVGEVSRALKNIARMFDVPVIALSQLTRNAEDQIPTLRDLKESGDIEQDADQVMFIHKNKNNTDGTMDFIIAKNRHGPIGYEKLVFEKKYNRFLNYYR